jgi:hypothetical protein
MTSFKENRLTSHQLFFFFISDEFTPRGKHPKKLFPSLIYHFIIEQLNSNKSNLSLIISMQNKHGHYNYLQLILKQKLFTKLVKNTKLEGLGTET